MVSGCSVSLSSDATMKHARETFSSKRKKTSRDLRIGKTGMILSKWTSRRDTLPVPSGPSRSLSRMLDIRGKRRHEEEWRSKKEGKTRRLDDFLPCEIFCHTQFKHDTPIAYETEQTTDSDPLGPFMRRGVESVE
jgi:hypothetical protein